MRILSYNPGHDGAAVVIEDGRLVVSIEAEKNSNYRYSPASISNVLDTIGELTDVPDVVCASGWWFKDHEEYLNGSLSNAGYRGLADQDAIASHRTFLGRQVKFFSSSHERSHLLCAYGMSPFPKGTPCYALVWEGALGAFYEIDSNLHITLLGDVLGHPGNRYGLLYGLADPTFPKDGPYPRDSDAGKLMALASFSTRSTPTPAEENLLNFLLKGSFQPLNAYGDLARAPHLDVGLDDQEFRNFCGIYSDAIFDAFFISSPRSNSAKAIRSSSRVGVASTATGTRNGRTVGFFPMCSSRQWRTIRALRLELRLMPSFVSLATPRSSGAYTAGKRLMRLALSMPANLTFKRQVMRKSQFCSRMVSFLGEFRGNTRSDREH